MSEGMVERGTDAPGRNGRWSPLTPVLVALPVLVLASVGCLVVLQIRADYTGRATFDFMAKNLFLAWLPLCFASLAGVAYATGRRIGYAAIPLLALVWLLFLPNAPYLVTDLIHLRDRGDGLAFFLDGAMLTGFAVTGILLGLVSLRLMHNLVAALTSPGVAWLFAVAALGLSAIGVYLGRFLRWNSWDALLRPESVARDLWRGLRDPFSYGAALEFTLIVAAFLIVSYLVLVAIGQIGRSVAR
jgi:uncharacterized membrane protein